MKIPARVNMPVVIFGDGAKGMALQISRNDEYGIQCDARRKDRRSPFVETWTSDYLPERAFATPAELVAALADVEPVKLVWAVIEVEPKGKGGSGRCWLCRGDWVHTVIAKTGWRDGDQERIPCCEADLARVKADPAAAVEARRKHVRETPPL